MPDADADHSEKTDVALIGIEIGREAEIGSVGQSGGEGILSGMCASAQQSRSRCVFCADASGN